MSDMTDTETRVRMQRLLRERGKLWELARWCHDPCMRLMLLDQAGKRLDEFDSLKGPLA